MSSQTNLPTRRQFLERSAWGFGSILLSSSILESCMTDHALPPPYANPSLLGLKINWYDDARTAIINALGLIPEAGGILSGLVNFLWPSTKEDVWDTIKVEVEALVKQKIDALVYQQVQDDLKGLNNSTILYLNEIKNGNAVSQQGQWLVTRNSFATALPHFQSKGYEGLLLPLFAQFANMYLSILRDGVAYGRSWGRTDADYQQDVADLKNAITNFITYTQNTYRDFRSELLRKTKKNTETNEPFRTVNSYDNQTTVTVLEFMDTWPYFDFTIYDKGVNVVVPNREIYSDPYGLTNTNPINLPSPPTQAPTTLLIWHDNNKNRDYLDAINLWYLNGGGPNNSTATGRMGGTDLNDYFRDVIEIKPNNPIVQTRAIHDGFITGVQFKFYDGTLTEVFGEEKRIFPIPDSGLIGYAYRFMSSLYINGKADVGGPECIVFGFETWTPPEAMLRTMQNFYVTSPTEHSATDLIKIAPTLSASPITEELKAARQAYWASIQARAEALK